MVSGSANDRRFDMANGNWLASFDGRTGGVDGGEVVNSGRVAGRHAYQKDCNRSRRRDAQDFEVGFSIGVKNCRIVHNRSFPGVIPSNRVLRVSLSSILM